MTVYVDDVRHRFGRQAERPEGFVRFWRISLTDFGRQDEVVEFIDYLPDGRAHVRFVRDGFDDAVSPHQLFPLSAEEHAEVARQHPRGAPLQLNLFADVEAGVTA